MTTRTIANIALTFLSRNNYALTSFPKMQLTDIENLIQDVIDYVNLDANITIPDLAGTPGALSMTADGIEYPVVKMISSLILHSLVNRGPNASLGVASVSSSLSEATGKVEYELIERGLNRLRKRSFERTFY